jgi:hypothetical protein
VDIQGSRQVDPLTRVPRGRGWVRLVKALCAAAALVFCGPAMADQACPSPGEQVSALNAALDEARLAQALELTLAIEPSLLCQSEPVSSLSLTPLFHLAAATQLFNGEEAGAEKAFAWSVGISPVTLVDAMLGQRVAQKHEEVRQAMLGAPGSSLRIDGDVEIWVDGRAAEPGQALDLVGGPHLLQWREVGEDLQNQIMHLIPGEARSMILGADGLAPPPIPVPGPLASWVLGNRRSVLYAGAGLTTIGLGLMTLAAQSHARFEEAEDPTQLEGLQARTNAYGSAGVLFTMLGTGSLGVAIGVKGTW